MTDPHDSSIFIPEVCVESYPTSARQAKLEEELRIEKFNTNVVIPELKESIRTLRLTLSQILYRSPSMEIQEMARNTLKNTKGDDDY